MKKFLIVLAILIFIPIYASAEGTPTKARIYVDPIHDLKVGQVINIWGYQEGSTDPYYCYRVVENGISRDIVTNTKLANIQFTITKPGIIQFGVLVRDSASQTFDANQYGSTYTVSSKSDCLVQEDILATQKILIYAVGSIAGLMLAMILVKVWLRNGG